MPSLYISTEIQAPRPIVWSALVQKDAWLRWNTYLYDLSPRRPFRPHETVALAFKRNSRDTETRIEPVVLGLQPMSLLHWAYKAPGFRCEHSFELQDSGQSRTRYTHRIRFTGALSSFFLPFIRQDEQRGARRMAQELKHYVEGY